MKVVVINDPNADRAKAQLKSDLGISDQDFRLVGSENRRCTFEVLSCPGSIDVEISRDAMEAYLTRVRLPIGDRAPKLSTDYLVRLLHEKGVKQGILHDAVAAEIHRIVTTPGFDDEQRFRVLVAKGMPPISGKSGRPKLLVELKLFENNGFVMARKGDVLAKAPSTAKGQDGYRVTGEKISALTDDQFKLTIGAGIEIQSADKEIHYVIKQTGRLFYDQGIRWRVESKPVPLKEGLDAGFEIGPKSFSGARISAKDLLETAAEAGLAHGLLSPDAIEAQIKAAKKWPAVVMVAKGTESIDGKAGDVVALYKNAKGTSPLDQERVKAQIVFPGEEILLLKAAKPPVDGKTAFGEVIRGRAFDELAVYPGRGVNKERRGGDVVFKAATYGRVSLENDRINVLNILEISKDSMEATIDFFPQQPVPAVVVIDMLRERDVYFGYEKDDLQTKLERAQAAGDRIPRFVVAKGRAPTKGVDARVDFKFDPSDFGQKGIFQKKADKTYFVLPGDLLLVKYLPVETQDGMNILRERIEVAKGERPKDIAVDASDNVEIVELGRPDDDKDPLRWEYRSAVLGTLLWNSKKVDVKPTISISKDESRASIKIAHKSDFGSLLTTSVIQKVADDEGIKVDLNWPEINKAIALSKVNPGELQEVVLAQSVEPKHGENARIQYFVEFNGMSIEQFLGQRSRQDPKAELLDCVRPGDVLAVKTPAGAGVDGKNIFGRRIPADRGADEPFLYGFGVDKSKDGAQIFCNLSCPGYVLVEQGRIVVRNLVKPSKDKMSASMDIYPSRSGRFNIREDKIFAMIKGAGIKFGLKERAVREAVAEALESNQPVKNLVVAEGRLPEKGKNATFRYTVDLGSQVGTMREDGSIDFKNKNMFNMVKAGQILIIKLPPSKGDDGSDVYGNKLPSALGKDGSLQAGSGVELDPTGLEYKAAIDGVLEVSPKSIRVIPGLLVNSDVGPKTGNINSEAVRVIVKGSVLPDFEVISEKEILVEKAAEGCRIQSKSQISVRGGIIGLGKALVTTEGDIEAAYITSDARVEVGGNLRVGSEVMHSKIICRGDLICTDGAGTIVGGETVVYKTLKCKSLSTQGAETPTVVVLGEDHLGFRLAEKQMKESGLADKVAQLQAELQSLAQELRLLYNQVLEAGRESPAKAAELNAQYRLLYEKHKGKIAEGEALEAQRQEVLSQYPYNKDFVLTVKEIIHPGTVLRYKGVQWAIKEPMRSVEIRWNLATSNFTSRRI